MRPFGPVPSMVSSVIPACCAIRRARGEAKIRPCAGAWGCAAATANTGEGEDAAMGASATAGVAAAEVAAGAAAVSVPSPSSTPIVAFTATPDVPSGTRMWVNTPSSTASTSIVALSVSISARTSPERTLSPVFLSHRASVPSVMVGDRAGMRMFTAIRRSSVRRPQPRSAAVAPAFPDLRRRAAAHPGP